MTPSSSGGEGKRPPSSPPPASPSKWCPEFRRLSARRQAWAFRSPHREVSASVSLATAHAQSGDEWRLAPSLPADGTLVLYMGLGKLKEAITGLLAQGRSPSTPAAVVASATLPNERLVLRTLADLEEKVEAAGIQPPALAIVGEVVAHRVVSVAVHTERKAARLKRA